MRAAWQVKPLGAVCQLINGRAFKPNEWESDGLPIIRIQNLNDPSKPFNYYRGSLPQKFRVRPGDVLLSWSGTPGTSFGCFQWSGPEGWLNQHIFNVKLPATLSPRFFVYQVNSKLAEIISKAHGGVGLQHVTKGILNQINLSIPPFTEQEQIVRILDAAEELRKLRAQADRRTADLIPAIFHDMFGDPATANKRWRTVKLGDLIQAIDSGWSPKCHDRPATAGKWGILKLGAVTSCRFLQGENKALPVEESSRPELEVKAGDLLFSRKNTYNLVGACAYVTEVRPKLMLSDLIFRLRLRNSGDIVPEYLWGILTQPWKRSQIQSLAGGSAGSMPNVSKERLQTLPIELPPPNLQHEFAARVAEFRAMEAQQAASRRRLDDLFQSLVHRAFSGKP